jgi:hypothetical protein
MTAPFERCYKITNLPLCVCRERINVVQEYLSFHSQPPGVH